MGDATTITTSLPEDDLLLEEENRAVLTAAQLDFATGLWGFGPGWAPDGDGAITESAQSKDQLNIRFATPEAAVTDGLTLSFDISSTSPDPGLLWITVTAQGGGYKDMLRTGVDPNSGRVELDLGTVPAGIGEIKISMFRTLERKGDVTISDIALTSTGATDDGVEDPVTPPPIEGDTGPDEPVTETPPAEKPVEETPAPEDGGTDDGIDGAVLTAAQLDFATGLWGFGPGWAPDGDGAITESAQSKDQLNIRFATPEAAVTDGLTLSFDISSTSPDPGLLWITVTAQGGGYKDMLRTGVDPNSGRVELDLGTVPAGIGEIKISMFRTLERKGDVTISDIALTSTGATDDGVEDPVTPPPIEGDTGPDEPVTETPPAEKPVEETPAPEDGGTDDGIDGAVLTAAQLDFATGLWGFGPGWAPDGDGAITESAQSKDQLNIRFATPEAAVTDGLTLSFDISSTSPDPGLLWITVTAQGGGYKDMLRTGVDPNSGRVELDLGTVPAGIGEIKISMFRTLERKGDVTISDIALTSTGATDDGVEDPVTPPPIEGDTGPDEPVTETPPEDAPETDAPADTYGSMYFFGDSLTDAARYGRSTQDFEGKHTANWADLLPLSLGATYDATSQYNYAVGGAQSGYDNVLNRRASDTGFLTQVDKFEASNTTVADNDIAAVWVGINDIWVSAWDAPTSGLLAPLGIRPSVEALTDYVVGNIRSGVESLVESGFKKVLLLSSYDAVDADNIPDDPETNALVSIYSTSIRDAMSDLSFSGAQSYFLDMVDLLNDVQADPDTFDFTFTDGAENLAASGQTGLTLEQQNEYIFADNVHFTNGFHQVIADRAAELILTTDGFDFTPQDYDSYNIV